MDRSTSLLIIKGDKIYSEKEFRAPTPAASNHAKKSILKPCTLRRSVSMESNEVEKKNVAFRGPQSVVDINFIDEKMKRSYIEDNKSLIGSYRRRSQTVPNNTNYFAHKIPIRAVPNFKAIHEQEFNKMESLKDHAQRKAERAKRLLTPTSAPTTLSKKPLMTPLESTTSSNDFVRNSAARTPITSRTSFLKRPAVIPYIGPPSKITRISSPKIDEKQASLNAINFVKKEESPIARIISKITGSSSSKLTPIKERTLLKGVRLNKRFELQMKHQQINPQGRL